MKTNNKISLICACKNRIKPLSISLSSWILCDEIAEIIIVDWNSDESIDYITNLDPKIKVVRVSDQEFFNQPQPLNLALKLCTQESVIKVDADYVFNPYWNFFDGYLIDDNSFVCGDVNIENIDSSVQPYFKYLRGTLYVKRKFLEEVGGWNENMGEYYGGEDGEIENRLELYGLTKKKLNLDYTIMHIPHSNKERVKNFKGYNHLNESVRGELSQGLSGNELEWNVEYVLAERHININICTFYNSTSYYVEPKTNWDIIQLDDQNYIANMV
jgi:hypothetical protein